MHGGSTVSRRYRSCKIFLASPARASMAHLSKINKKTSFANKDTHWHIFYFHATYDAEFSLDLSVTLSFRIYCDKRSNFSRK